MQKTLVICAGPWMGLPKTAMPEGARLLVFSTGIGGIGSSHFAALGRKYGGSIRSLAAARGVDLSEFGAVALVGFSAAHGLFESLLRGPDAARVNVLHAADAYFTGPGLEVKRGYRAMLERAAAGNALAVLTTSHTAGPGYPSSAAAVAELVKGLDLAPTSLDWSHIPEPVALCSRNGCIWADYGDKFKHAEHATKLAPLWWQWVGRRYLESGAPSDGGGLFDCLLALAALGLVWSA